MLKQDEITFTAINHGLFVPHFNHIAKWEGIEVIEASDSPDIDKVSLTAKLNEQISHILSLITRRHELKLLAPLEEGIDFEIKIRKSSSLLYDATARASSNGMVTDTTMTFLPSCTVDYIYALMRILVLQEPRNG